MFSTLSLLSCVFQLAILDTEFQVVLNVKASVTTAGINQYCTCEL